MDKKGDYEKVEGLFIDLMVTTLEKTLAKLKSQAADSKDVRNAITLLKDNGFTMRDLRTTKDPEEFLAELMATLPALPAISPNGEIVPYVDCEEEE